MCNTKLDYKLFIIYHLYYTCTQYVIRQLIHKLHLHICIICNKIYIIYIIIIVIYNIYNKL